MLKDFKAFIMRGNVVDMAVGIIIGAAFGPIVASLVKDVIMPPNWIGTRESGLRKSFNCVTSRQNSRDLCLIGRGSSGRSRHN